MADTTTPLDGLYIHGLLQGVEPTKSGKNSEISWDASLKLSFLSSFVKSTDFSGTIIKSQATRLVVISIKATDDQLPALVNQYSAKLNTRLSLQLEPTKNSVFKIVE